MSAKPTYETQRIDHLGIVAGICQEISLIEKIDAQVKARDRKVSCGKGAQAIILNALGFVGRALYLMPGIPPKKWRQRKDKVHLIRRKEHVPKAEAEL